MGLKKTVIKIVSRTACLNIFCPAAVLPTHRQKPHALSGHTSVPVTFLLIDRFPNG